jgi:steroid delta-isomerase-like uncharacterized protein
MSTEDNKAAVRRGYEEGFNQRKLAVFDELMAPDYVWHLASMTIQGREPAKQLIWRLLTAFPDGRFTIEDMIAEGDRVVVRQTFRGTQQGDFLGIPPTGKQVTATGIEIFRVAHGKSVENWTNEDDLGLMHQLGGVPFFPTVVFSASVTSFEARGKQMSNAQQALPVLEGYAFTSLTPQEFPLLQTLCELCTREIEQSTHLQPGLTMEHVLGHAPGPSMAWELALALPAGKGYEDKLLLGIFARSDRLIGVLAAIRDYPVPGEWWLGLLMLEPAQRGRGLGENICRAFEHWARNAGARYLRLVVSAQNRRGHHFWQRLGFEELERRVRKLSDGQESEVIIMGHPL